MRTSVLSAALLGACLALSGGAAAQDTAPPATQTLTAEQQAEIAAAEANVALIATRPRWASGPDAGYPEEERALGHHGRVEVRGLLGLDGRVRYATVSRSSRAPVLDQLALETVLASEYQPAKDASGNPIPIMFDAPVTFYSFTSSEGVGAAMYTCRQFVLDMDWFKATWDEGALHDHYFYVLIRGLGTIARMSNGGGIGNIESNESYARRWDRAIETCREHPDRRFAQAMRPEGEYIDRMAAQQRR